MADKRRAQRVSQKIREIIASELLHITDPRFALVTVTNVVVNSDLREAKIYWNVTGPRERIAEVEEALQNAAGHFRHVVASSINMRFAPRLSFFYDTTLDTYEEVARLLKGVEGDLIKPE